MSDFFEHLLMSAFQETNEVRPRLIARFEAPTNSELREPQPVKQEDWQFTESFSLSNPLQRGSEEKVTISTIPRQVSERAPNFCPLRQQMPSERPHNRHAFRY